MSIAVLCPSRGNPLALHEAYVSFVGTKELRTTSFVGIVDYDDPRLPEYDELDCEIEVVPEWEVGNMNRALNWASARWAHFVEVVGFVGDDHRFRSEGWDCLVEQIMAEKGGGILYGDDLAQRMNLPTQVFISSGIVRLLGWMGLPGAKHLYLDNTWRLLGERAKCLYYAPEMVIEHMHPAFGKAEWDENHKRVNSHDVYEHDAAAFQRWLTHGADEAVLKVMQALGR